MNCEAFCKKINKCFSMSWKCDETETFHLENLTSKTSEQRRHSPPASLHAVKYLKSLTIQGETHLLPAHVFLPKASGLESKSCHHLLVHRPRHGSHQSPPQRPWNGSPEEPLESVFLIDVSDGLCRPQLWIHLDVCFNHISWLRDQRRQNTRQDPTAEVRQRGRSRRADFFQQRGFGLAIEHDVDAREGNVSEESCHQAGEQSCRSFSPTHTPQSPRHTAVTVPATFKACLDDSDRQHEDPRHGSGPAPQQHGLQGPRASVLEEVLLQRVVGTEVEPHAWDGASEGLEEQEDERTFVDMFF